ncbi:MFS transporter [Chitinophaga horti]|uniref:MFS transporter n=1 Tax=Chitinophaga horti TaxID=2920382 RepID=A0ABY6J4E4_9BACT|nr:MFS transporter [Chitinophaga horti]UYQ94497.1 MFS transporter [Chitinophaga horti]
MKDTSVSVAAEPAKPVQQTVFSILFSISFAHLVNDMLQSVIPSVYPIFKEKYHLNFTQIGLITLVYQLTASLLQPLVGVYTDRRARPYSLPVGMAFTLTGLIALAFANSFYNILFSVSFIGIGSSIFHPESSRVAHLASGGKKGLAQSIFQLGGNAGSAIGPLLAALLVAPYGQISIAWFSIVALAGILVLSRVSAWYGAHLAEKAARNAPLLVSPFSRGKVIMALSILIVLIFSKYFYMASMSSYYTFFLIDKFHITTQQSQVYLFIFLGAVAAGTFIGGPLGDRFGRKYIIWFSILGAAPFTLLLPYVPLFWTAVLSVVIGVVIASAFSAILVYATELVPGKVGMIAGLFFGLAFGMGGLGSAVLGKLADLTSIAYVFAVCAYLPLIGILTGLLPNIERKYKA